MNARTVEKLLLRGRDQSFWGRRAYLHLRVPRALIPEPMPSCPDFGKPGVIEGSWVRDLGNDIERRTHITQVSGSRDPRLEVDHAAPRLLSEEDGWWRWWEATWVDTDGEDPETKRPRTVARGEVADEDFDCYMAHWQWVQRYAVGLAGPTGNDILDAVHDAANHAKTTYHEIDPASGDLVVIYSVKYFYRRRMLRFCRDVARVVNEAARRGVALRVMKGGLTREAE